MEEKTFYTLVLATILLVLACNDDHHEENVRDKETRILSNSSGHRSEEELTNETGASPYIQFYSVDEEDTVKVVPGESQTAQASLNITMIANVNNPNNYNYVCEWRVWRTNDNSNESTPLVTRFEEETSYTLTKSGGYGIKLYITFTQNTDTIEYESEQISVVISESKLTCPDGFSPNGDNINDNYRITAQSIIKLDAKFFDRWGGQVHSVTLETAKHAEGEPNRLILWDGEQNGKPVKNGVYFLYLDALGSDNIEYKIKKAINVLTGFRENEGESRGE